MGHLNKEINMKSFIVGCVMLASMTGVSFGGDCANGRCNLSRKHSQSSVNSQRVVRVHSGPVYSNARTSNQRPNRTVR